MDPRFALLVDGPSAGRAVEIDGDADVWMVMPLPDFSARLIGVLHEQPGDTVRLTVTDTQIPA